MVLADQAAREKHPIDPHEVQQLSESAHPLLESIYAGYGWPALSVFGAIASQDFWLLVQHQPLELQQRMLSGLKSEADLGEASERDYAYLFDRIQVSQGRPQHWGTQSHCQDGRAILYPAEDATHLEQLRQQIGLDPLEDSLRESTSTCTQLRY
jgi:hypothetical protein